MLFSHQQYPCSESTTLFRPLGIRYAFLHLSSHSQTLGMSCLGLLSLFIYSAVASSTTILVAHHYHSSRCPYQPLFFFHPSAVGTILIVSSILKLFLIPTSGALIPTDLHLPWLEVYFFLYLPRSLGFSPCPPVLHHHSLIWLIPKILRDVEWCKAWTKTMVYLLIQPLNSVSLDTLFDFSEPLLPCLQ